MDPNDVLSPRQLLRLVMVVYDEGEDHGLISLAVGYYGNEPTLLCRYNGPPGTLGMPISSGHAVWFVLPPGLWEAGLAMIDDGADRAFARHFLKLDEDAAIAAE